MTSAFARRTEIAADGTSLGVWEANGTGPLVVALHGFTGDGSTMLPLLELVRQGRPALAIDIVGHGASDAPDYVDSYSMAAVVDQVLSLIGPRERDSVHLIGYSMGGRIALSLGARAPWYFASITTLSSTAGIDDVTERAKRQKSDGELAARIEAIGVDSFIDEWLALPLFSSYVASLSQEDRQRTEAVRQANSATGLANSLRGTGTGAMPPVWSTLVALRSPLLAVAGQRDTRYVEIAERLAATVRDGQIHIVADAGHVVHDENLDECASVVASFLQCCDTPGPEGAPT